MVARRVLFGPRDEPPPRSNRSDPPVPIGHLREAIDATRLKEHRENQGDETDADNPAADPKNGLAGVLRGLELLLALLCDGAVEEFKTGRKDLGIGARFEAGFEPRLLDCHQGRVQLFLQLEVIAELALGVRVVVGNGGGDRVRREVGFCGEGELGSRCDEQQ